MSPDPSSKARLSELRGHVREALHPVDHEGLREKARQVNEWVARQHDLDSLPIGSVVMTETVVEQFGVYEQRIWQKFGGKGDWQFGIPRHDWQSTDGGFVRVGDDPQVFAMNRKVTVLYTPDGADRG